MTDPFRLREEACKSWDFVASDKAISAAAHTNSVKAVSRSPMLTWGLAMRITSLSFQARRVLCSKLRRILRTAADIRSS